MNLPRELVYKTLDFNEPERLPRHLWYLPWIEANHLQVLEKLKKKYPDDIVTAPSEAVKQPKTTGSQYEIGTYIDEWGCVFKNVQKGVVGEVKEPIVKEWKDIGKVKLPHELLEVDKDAVNDFCRKSDRFVMSCCCPRPFERLQFIRGTENVMMDMAYNSSELDELLGIIHEFYLKKFEIWAKTDVDGLYFMDDWGSQRALLVSPDMWRKKFKPLYKDYIEIAKHYKKKSFMHSDGYILDILPDLIEIGLDAINSQIFCMDIENLGKKYRGSITFWGEIDRQNLLPNATTDEIDTAVERVYNNLYSNGGIIAQFEFTPGSRPENALQIFESWGKYPKSN